MEGRVVCDYRLLYKEGREGRREGEKERRTQDMYKRVVCLVPHRLPVPYHQLSAYDPLGEVYTIQAPSIVVVCE
jgi:hypothetical protein